MSRPRRLIAMFIGVVMLVSSAFGWLSWRVIEQDRALERQRLLDRRDAEAAAAANSLQRVLLDTLDQVTAEKPLADEDAVLIVIRPNSIEALPRSRLCYWPTAPSTREPPFGPFAAADALEMNEAAKALDALSAPARSRDSAVRAGALLRIGRIQRKAGRYAEALRAYEELSAIDGVSIGGEPVSLAARHARCQILSGQGDQARAEAETSLLRDDLRSGRWLLSKSVYSLYAGWLKISDPKAVALADAVDHVWRDADTTRALQGWSRVSHLLMGDEAFFVFRHRLPGRLVALVARPAFLEKRWRGTLTDGAGRVLLGSVSAASDATRVPVASGLPWVIHVRASQTETVSAAFARRRGFVIGGLAIIGLFAAAATYFIAQGFAREFAFARLQSDFVSAVSHEFRTPLTTMRQLTELLKKGRVATETKREEYYDLLAKETERLQRLVEDLLDFRRMEANAVEFTFEPLDPAGLLRGVVADFQQKAGAQGFQVELIANGDAPPIRGDRESLRRVVWNLLENAVKYSPECRTVWVELVEQARQVAIRVRDRGIGIPLNEQESVFEKFVRGREAKSANIAGTGLGLAMVRHIVRSHGGRVEVSSRLGEGSTFTVVLPAME